MSLSPALARRLVGVGAWIFVGCSLLMLMAVLGAGLSSPGAVSRMWVSGVDADSRQTFLAIIQIPLPGDEDDGRILPGTLREAFGLTYRGSAGLALAGCQLVLVCVCCVLTLSAHAFRRRLGHLGLVGWAGLWLGNAVWMALTAPVTPTIIACAVMLAFFLCVLSRALLAGRRSPRTLLCGTA